MSVGVGNGGFDGGGRNVQAARPLGRSARTERRRPGKGRGSDVGSSGDGAAGFFGTRRVRNRTVWRKTSGFAKTSHLSRRLSDFFGSLAVAEKKTPSTRALGCQGLDRLLGRQENLRVRCMGARPVHLTPSLFADSYQNPIGRATRFSGRVEKASRCCNGLSAAPAVRPRRHAVPAARPQGEVATQRRTASASSGLLM